MAKYYMVTDIKTSGIGDNSVALKVDVHVDGEDFEKQFQLQLTDGITLSQVKSRIDSDIKAFISEESRKLAIIANAGGQLIDKRVDIEA